MNMNFEGGNNSPKEEKSDDLENGLNNSPKISDPEEGLSAMLDSYDYFRKTGDISLYNLTWRSLDDSLYNPQFRTRVEQALQQRSQEPIMTDEEKYSVVTAESVQEQPKDGEDLGAIEGGSTEEVAENNLETDLENPKETLEVPDYTIENTTEENNAEVGAEENTAELTEETPDAQSETINQEPEKEETPEQKKRRELDEKYDAIGGAELRIADLLDGAEDPWVWDDLKEELDDLNIDYKSSGSYQEALRAIVRKNFKMYNESKLGTIKKAVELFGEDILTEEIKRPFIEKTLESSYIDTKFYEATGIDLSEYHDEGLKKLNSVLKNSKYYDRARGSLEEKDILNWREKFNITDEEFAEEAHKFWEENHSRLESHDYGRLGILVPDGYGSATWVWNKYKKQT